MSRVETGDSRVEFLVRVDLAKFEGGGWWIGPMLEDGCSRIRVWPDERNGSSHGYQYARLWQ